MVQKKSEEEKKKKITLTVDKRVYDKFAQYCKERGMKVSPKVELLMQIELKMRKQK